jgi:hypothetical protein
MKVLLSVVVGLLSVDASAGCIKDTVFAVDTFSNITVGASTINAPLQVVGTVNKLMIYPSAVTPQTAEFPERQAKVSGCIELAKTALANTASLSFKFLYSGPTASAVDTYGSGCVVKIGDTYGGIGDLSCSLAPK